MPTPTRSGSNDQTPKRGENEDMNNPKVKLTIKFPRCLKCRENIVDGELTEILDMVEQTIKNRMGTSIPITITIQKQSIKRTPNKTPKVTKK